MARVFRGLRSSKEIMSFLSTDNTLKGGRKKEELLSRKPDRQGLTSSSQAERNPAMSEDGGTAGLGYVSSDHAREQKRGGGEEGFQVAHRINEGTQ